MFTSIYIYHISYHRYVCISTLAVHSHTCLCPCERSHLEPLCIHTCFRSISHYIDRIMDSFVYEPILQENTNVCAFASAHTYNLFVYMHILTSTRMLYHKYFVYEPMLCKLTYICALLSPHALNLMYLYISSQVYMYQIIDTLVYQPKYCNSHLSVPLWVLTLESSLYTCIYIYIYFFHKLTYIMLYIYIYVYKQKCCANSRMSLPVRGLTLRTSLCTYICSQVYIYHVTDTFVYQPLLCTLTLVCALASAHT